jgi:hypothetical protein
VIKLETNVENKILEIKVIENILFLKQQAMALNEKTMKILRGNFYTYI